MGKPKSEFAKRAALYGGAALVLGALGYYGFLYQPGPGLDQRLEPVFYTSRSGDFAEARRLLAEIRADVGEHVKLRLADAFLDEREGRLESARATYSELAQSVPEDSQRSDLLLSVADIDRRSGRRAEAEAQLDAIVSRFGQSSRARQLRISLYCDAGRLTDALSEARALAEEDPGYPHAARLRRQLEQLAETAKSTGVEASEASSSANR